jgi:hypothetical protein
MLNIGADINTQTISMAASQENGAAPEKFGLNALLSGVQNTSEQRSDAIVNQTNPLPPKLKLYMHTTAEENLPSIHTTGLIAGKDSPAVAGMGDTDQGKPCKERIYVVMPKSSIGTDTRSGVVGIASNHSPTRDVNYPAGKAGVFLTDKIVPLREAAITVVVTPPEDNQDPATPSTPPAQCYSFVPENISPKTKAGAAALYAQHGIDLSPNSAAQTLVKGLKENYPIHTLGIALPSSSKSTTERQCSSSGHSLSPNSNDPNNNDLLFDYE